MEKHEGFWYSIGDFFYSFFKAMEWTYEHLSPNKVLIVLGFICFFWWMWLQANYNKKAVEQDTYK
ncbi:MAG TPA: hypothetical protein VI731_10935 [Bacteroidia bacterium]|nr:hypothetical protein [Bacteroidia bacterium]